ncbi:MAG: cyclic nucleotide-binding domain-containing protein [bacterium]|nr:cyclic nucleotide-binding domain-containing protein [bacterium]
MAIERSCKAGTKIVDEGSSCGEFFICIEGELAVQIDVPGKGVITTSTLSRNNVFGWSALTDIPDYTASVVVNSECTLSGCKIWACQLYFRLL